MTRAKFRSAIIFAITSANLICIVQFIGNFEQLQNIYSREPLEIQTTYALKPEDLAPKPPAMHNFLPHLQNCSSCLKPAFLLAPYPRTNVSIVIGVPTVLRFNASYIIDTLASLVSNMSPEESQDCLIILFIGETRSVDVELLSGESVFTS